LRVDAILRSLMFTHGDGCPTLTPAAGIAPGDRGECQRHAVDNATGLIDPGAVQAFLVRLGQGFSISVRHSNLVQSSLPDEWATRRISHALHLSRWVDHDLESWAITQEYEPLVVLCDESDSMDALGPHGLAGIAWAHALVEVIAADTLSFGGGRVAPYTPGRRLGGGTDLTGALEWVAAQVGANHTVVIVTDGQVRLDKPPLGMRKCGVIAIPNGRLATIQGPQIGLTDLLRR
jgi:hypothetical protein